jgi:hypothetical protein
LALPHRFRGAADEWTLKDNIAVLLKPLVVLDTKKWFGEADLRLDILVIHGGPRRSPISITRKRSVSRA